MKNKTIDFMKGTISLEQYIDFCIADEFDFLQNLVKEGETTNRFIPHDGKVEVITIPYMAKEVILGIYKPGVLAAAVDCFSEICRLMKRAFPNEEFEIDTTLLEVFEYLLENTPAYIGGLEAEEVLVSIFRSIASPFTASGKAHYKRAVKENFQCRNNKTPRWLQAPEWPVSCKKPLTFVEECKDGEGKRHYLFLNEQTQEKVDVVQII